jgi:Flp pilus assembly protein TadD
LPSSEASVTHDLGSNFARHGYIAVALEFARWGLRLNRENPDLLADAIIWSGETDDETIQLQIHRLEAAPEAALRVANTLRGARLFLEAAKVLERLARLYRTSPEVFKALAKTYLEWGKEAEAKECFAKALALDPFHPTRDETSNN